MHFRQILLAAAVLGMGAVLASPISADQDPALSHLRSIASRPDVVSALGRFGELGASSAGQSAPWEQDMLDLQHQLQADVFGTP